MVCPSLSEADMSKTDRSPGERRRETGEREKLTEDFRAARGHIDVSEAAESNDGDGRN